MILFQAFISFFATLFFAILFNAPRKLLIACGFVGAVGWVVYYIANMNGLSDAVSIFLGSFSLSICAHILARIYKRPVIIFNVSGIIPLVPGGVAYDATKNLIISDFSEAIIKGSQATLSSGAIAFGLVTAEMLFLTVMRTYKHLKAKQIKHKNP
ncbi:threonine/serine exporter family protein [Macrococcus armenti]|uniref:threonine/serine exporter family protein n=1 Tax=Macrococcus armenti TaxID=2875764 RepID=UPI001CCE97AE|nr:threonine/serine exporter family protein [Macrococcus armenti]UBH13672.1 threonine/serine exporter family protein [Macrococcus armenti]UBH22899.1 threonine/serine exporter family protein [Macrococcus armenti]